MTFLAAGIVGRGICQVGPFWEVASSSPSSPLKSPCSLPSPAVPPGSTAALTDGSWQPGLAARGGGQGGRGRARRPPWAEGDVVDEPGIDRCSQQILCAKPEDRSLWGILPSPQHCPLAFQLTHVCLPCLPVSCGWLPSCWALAAALVSSPPFSL